MMKTIALAFAFGAIAFPALAQIPATAPTANAQAAAFSVDSSIGELLAHAGARAALQEQLPELIATPGIEQAGSMTLRQLAEYAPVLTETKLAEINTALAAVPR